MAETIVTVYKADVDEYLKNLEKAEQANLGVALAEKKVETTQQQASKGRKEQIGLIEQLRKKEADLIKLRDKSVSTHNIKKYNKEIEETRAKVNNLTGSTKKLEQGSSALGTRLKTLAAGFIAAFSIQRVIGGAIKTIAGFQQKLAEVGSITGLVGTDLAGLGDTAIEISTKFGTSAEDVLAGFQLVGSAKPELLANADALAAVTLQAEILGKAAGSDLPSAAGVLTKALNQYGEGANKAAMFTDILATSQQKGTATAVQLGDSLVNGGATANAFKLSFEETNAILQGFAAGGTVGSEAGTQLSGVLSKLAKTDIKEFNTAQTNAIDVIDNLANANLSYTDLLELTDAEGAKWLSTLLAQNDTVQELNGTLYEQGNALKQAEQNTDTLQGKQAVLGTTYDSFIFSIEKGDGVISEFFKEAIEGATDFFNLLKSINEEGLIQGFVRIDPQVKAFQANIDSVVKAAKEAGGQTKEDAVNNMTDLIAETEMQLKDAIARGDGIGAQALEVQIDIMKQGLFQITEASRSITEESGNAFLERAAQDEEFTQKVIQNAEKRIEAARAEIELIKETAGVFDIAAIAQIQEQEAVINNSRERIVELLSFQEQEAKKTDEEIQKGREEAAKRSLELDDAIAQARIALIADEGERAIAQINLNFEKATRELSVNKEKEAELLLLLEQQKDQDIADSEEKFRLEAQKADEKAFEDEYDQRLSDLNTLATAQELFIEQTISDENEADLLRLKNKEEFLKSQIELNEEFGEETIEQQLELAEVQNEIFDEIQAQQDERDKLDEERLQRRFDLQKSLLMASVELVKIAGNESVAAAKAVAIAQIAIARGEAIAQLVRDVQAIGLTPIEKALIFATGLVQIGTGIAQARQALEEFRDGVIDYQGVGTETSDSNVVRISRGESVIKADATKKHLEELHAIQDGRFDTFVHEKYVLPMISERIKENARADQKDFASNIAEGLSVSAALSDGNILRSLKSGRKQDRELNEALIKALTGSSYLGKRKRL